MELSAFLPIDRRIAMLQGKNISDRVEGAALSADISGFTPLTEALSLSFGTRRGAEEMTVQLNRIFTTLVDDVHRFGGSVISFSGDALMCWFDRSLLKEIAGYFTFPDPTIRAAACALAMQNDMRSFASIQLDNGQIVSLAIKVSIVEGETRRFVVGDPSIQRIDVLAGKTLNTLAYVEHINRPGLILIDPASAVRIRSQVRMVELISNPDGTIGAFVLGGLQDPIPETPWPEMPQSRAFLEDARRWVLPKIFHLLQQGEGKFLSDLRPAVSMFLSFSGIEYDEDDDAGIWLDAYIRRVQAAASQYEASIIQLTIGDKGSYLYIIFGALVAHDDDAVRAVTAGLSLRIPPPNLAYIQDVRIGITQGEMYSGTYGSPMRCTYGVLSDKTNLAARLMQQAAPGSILCDEELFAHANHRWAFKRLLPLQVKGKIDPISVYSPTGLPAENMPDPQTARTDPFLGRAETISQLLVRLQSLQTGRGCVLFIEGEAGIGKTRLLGEMLHMAGNLGFSILDGEGQSIEQHTPYRAWRTVFESFFAISESDPLEERRTQVTKVVQVAAPKMIQRLPLLNDILNLNFPDTPLTAALDHALRHESLVGLLIQLLRVRVHHQPLFLALDDAHWLDQLSWDLTVQVARALIGEGAALLLVLVYRPLEEETAAYRSAAVLQSMDGSQKIELNSLGQEEVVTLAASRLGIEVEHLPEQVSRLVWEQSEGNPFFAEEIVYALLDRGMISVDRMVDPPVCRIHEDLAQTAALLPNTLQGLVLSRIDRLPAEQQFSLKVAAVIGRSFAFTPLFDTLNRLTQLPAKELNLQLAEFNRRALTLLETPEPDLKYLFRHIITHEVAYNTLLFSDRKQIHRTVAEWYEEQYRQETILLPVTSAESNAISRTQVSLVLPLLVYHYHQAEEREKERQFAQLAGEQAARQFANTDAEKYLTRALQLTLETDLRSRFLITRARAEIYDRLGERDLQHRDIAAIIKLADELDEPGLQAAAAIDEVWFADITSDYDRAYPLGEKAIELARISGNTEYEATAHLRMGNLYRYQSIYNKARDHYELGLEIARQAGHVEIQATILGGMGIVADLSGDPTLAQTYMEQQLALARQNDLRNDEGVALCNLGIIYWRKGNFTMAQALFEESLAIDRITGKRLGEGLTLGNLAMLALNQAEYDRARSRGEEGLSILRQVNHPYGISRILGIIGKAELDCHNYSKALDCFTEALRLDRDMGDHQDEGYQVNNLGDTLLKLGQIDTAKHHFEEALRLSMELEDLEVRANGYMGLGLVFLWMGDGSQAFGYLEKALESLPEGSEDRFLGSVQTRMGEAKLISGDLEHAQSLFEQAVESFRKAGIEKKLLDPFSGLAEVLLAKGKRTDALALVEPWLDTALNSNLEGTDNPMQVYLSFYHVLSAVADPRADSIRAKANKTLQERLTSLTDEYQYGFLNNNPAHREIVNILK